MILIYCHNIIDDKTLKKSLIVVNCVWAFLFFFSLLVIGLELRFFSLDDEEKEIDLKIVRFFIIEQSWLFSSLQLRILQFRESLEIVDRHHWIPIGKLHNFFTRFDTHKYALYLRRSTKIPISNPKQDQDYFIVLMLLCSQIDSCQYL